MNTLRRLLFPEFLQKLDRKLVLKYPALWLSNVHYLGYFLLLATAFTVAVGAIYPLSSGGVPVIENILLTWGGLFLIPLVLWVRHQLLQSPERLFGFRKSLQAQFILAVHTLALVGMLFQPALFLKLIGARVNSEFSVEELVEDTNALNMASAYMLVNQYDEKGSSGIHEVSDIPYHELAYFTSYKLEQLNRNYLANGDDVRKKLQDDFRSKTQAVTHIEKALAIMQKYGTYEAAELDANSLYEKSTKGYYMGSRTLREAKEKTRNQLHNIASLKDLHKDGVFIYEVVVSIFAAAFFLSLVLYVFKQMKFLHFAISVVSILGLSLGSGFFTALGSEFVFGHGFAEEFMLLITGGIFVLSGIYAFRTRKAFSFTKVRLVSLTLFTLALPLLGIWLMVFFSEMHMKFFPFFSYDNGYFQERPDFALLIGMAVFFFALFPLTDRLFLQLNTLPKEK